jgi:hypothetical protein
VACVASSSNAPSGAKASAPAAPPAPAPRFDIESVEVGGYGEIVKTRDGKTFMVLHPNQWPSAINEYLPGGPGAGQIAHDVRAPLVAELRASLARVSPGPNVVAIARTQALRWLEVGAVVMDPDWSDLVVTSVVQRSPRSFDMVLTKHGVRLDASVYRGSSRTYTDGIEHASRCTVELRWFGPELAVPLARAKLAPGVQPSLRDQMVALLAKPLAHTDSETE